MKKFLLKGIAVGLVLAASPMASAEAGDSIHGGCFFVTAKSNLSGGGNEGVIGDRSVTTGSNSLPTGATVDCWIEINGSMQGVRTFGDKTQPVQAGADQIAFDTLEGDLINLCQRVHYADGDTSPVTCPGAIQMTLPPPVVADAFAALFSGTLDPVACPILQSHAGTYGPITIESDDGDVLGPDTLGLNPYDDCPPYGDNT